MSTHLSTQQVEQYRRRELAPAELLDAGDHLVVCEACRLKIADAERLEHTLSALREDFRQEARQEQEHLTYEQLSLYVDDSLDEIEREIVDSHTFVCAPCKEELRDLFAFKDTLVTPPSVAKDERREASATSWERLNAWRRNWWQIMGAAAALILVTLGVWLALRTKDNSQVVVLQPTPTPTPLASPTLTPQPSPSASPSNNSNNTNPKPTPQVTPQVTPQSPRLPERKVPSPDASGAAPLIALNDNGRQIALDNRGRLTGIETVPTAEREIIRKALQTNQLEMPASLADLKRRDGTLLGAPGSSGDVNQSFAAIGPAGTIVQTERPHFRWQALQGAENYTVKIYDTDFNLVDASTKLTTTDWTPQKSLAPGRVYQWQVTATKDGSEIVSPAPPAPEARFKVLESAQRERLTRALRAARNSHLARGVIYTKAGLLDEAEREFEALLELNPESGVARKLLENVRAAR